MLNKKVSSVFRQGSITRQTLRDALPMMVSGAAFVLLTTPAWFSGMAAALVAAVILGFVILRLHPGKAAVRQLLSHPGMLPLGLIVTSAFGCNFYNTWLDSRYVDILAGMLHLPVSGFLFVCSAVMVLVSAPSVSAVLSLLIRSAGDDMARKKASDADASGRFSLPMGKALVVLFLILLAGFSAVLRTNFYYLDDNGRAAFGYKDWDYFGRYLSTGFSTLLHMGNYLTDITPLPQLTALGIMACAGVLLLYVFYGRTRFYLWEIAAVVPLALNPYFLECLSFRFDAPYMAISVLAGILPLLYRHRPLHIYLTASMLGIVAVCTSYQAASGIFPILVIALALGMYADGASFRDTSLFCLKSAAGYLMGLVYFKLIIMKPADAVYVSNSLPSASDLIPNAVSNLSRYYGLVLTDFKAFWLVLAALALAVYVFLLLSCARKEKLRVLALTLCGLVLMALLCFGIYPLLEATLFSPRAMYGFGVLLTVFCISGAQGLGKAGIKLPALVLSWVFFVFSFTYGNALNLQKEYTEFRLQMVLADLNDLPQLHAGANVDIELSGSIGKSPILSHMPQDYQMLNRLVPETFAGGDDLTEYRFHYYYGLQDVAALDNGMDVSDDLPVLIDSAYHTIYGNETSILVELK